MRKKIPIPTRPYLSTTMVREVLKEEVTNEVKEEFEQSLLNLEETLNQTIVDIIQDLESYSRYDLTNQVGSGNTTFNLEHPAAAETFICVLDGMIMNVDGDFSFTSESTIEFSFNIEDESTLLVFYKKL